MERSIELASNDDLRKYLAFAELARSIPVNASRIEPPAQVDSRNENELGDSPWPKRRHARPLREVVNSRGYSEENPQHTYVLAIDYIDDYRGHPWIPFNLLSASDSSVASTYARALMDSTGSRDLWDRIGDHYRGQGRPDSIAATLPIRCAEFSARWRALPKSSPSEYAEARRTLSRKASQLSIEIERFLAEADRDDGEGLTFMRLLSGEERERALQRVQRYCHTTLNKTLKKNGIRGIDYDDYVQPREGAREGSPLNLPSCIGDVSDAWDLIDSVVPPLPQLMARLSNLFADDAGNAPLSRPNAVNAERNYFASQLCVYFWTEYGSVSPAIVSRIVSVFHAQGISENEVSQIARRTKREHPLPMG